MYVLPKTKLGKWSLALIIAMPLLIIIGGSLSGTMYKSVEAGNGLIDDLAKRPALAVASLAGIAAGLASCVIGLIAISKKQERAILVYLSTLIGVLLIIFILGDLVSPHE